ncbi:MAG: DUF3810 domain-containing protein [Acidobacteriota bacterium]|nr:DUF3810 domain-containing protein [Acidobacteriota bacterium]
MLRKFGRNNLSGRAWWRGLLPPVCLLAAGFALQAAASFGPGLVERYYSRGLFPVVARAFVFARLVSFSLAEALLALLLASVALWLSWVARRLYARRGAARAVLLAALRTVLRVACAGLWLFLLVFGLNYQRQPLSETLQFERRDPTPVEIEAISRAVVEGVNRGYQESGSLVHESSAPAQESNPRVEESSPRGAGGSKLPLSRAELYAALLEAYRAEPLLNGASGAGVQPKPVYFSGLLSRFGISGIYSPFTGEPNYNSLQPDCDLPFAVAHEMAHQRGYAREDEANFIAFLVCSKSANPYVRYSGYLGALRVLGVLFRIAPERYRDVVAALGEGPRVDLRARAQFWARYQGRLANFGQGVNHVYLRINGVRSGVRNYNEASALIVGYYLQQMKAASPAAD